MADLRGKTTRVRRAGAAWAYLSSLCRELPLKVTCALGLMVGLTLTEGVGLLMLVPLLQVVGLDVQQGTPGKIVEFLSSLFQTAGLRPTLVSVLGCYIVITSLHAMLYRWHQTATLSLHHEMVARLRQRLYRALARANWLFFARSRCSDFSHVLTTEVERVGAAAHQLLHLGATVTVSLAYLLFALNISTVMTAIVLVCGVVLSLVLKGKTHIAHSAGEETSRAMHRLFGAIAEHVGGIKTVKSYAAEDHHVHLFTGLTDQVHRAYIKAIRNSAEVKSWFDIGSVLVLSVIVYLAFEKLAISTAEVLLLVFLFARLMPRFSSMLQGYQNFINLLPSFTSVATMQARCEAAAEPWGGTQDRAPLRRALHLEGVSFAYGETAVIQNLHLTVGAGETTAIVGPSGAGKTTVADLVMGLLVPAEGRILLDGSPLLPERMRAWRRQIGYVTQDTFLFHETVRTNLLWGQPGATEKEIWQALRLAAADVFVSDLPKGLDTLVGDRGVQVSGGERQRLALARALLTRPSLLILDEATSNLDTVNQLRILRAIDQLHGSMAILIISHRLSAVQGADVIHVLEDGQLVENESFPKLVAER